MMAESDKEKIEEEIEIIETVKETSRKYRQISYNINQNLHIYKGFRSTVIFELKYANFSFISNLTDLRQFLLHVKEKQRMRSIALTENTFNEISILVTFWF